MPRTREVPAPVAARDTADAPARGRSAWPVVLVCMPFMDDRRPSLPLGLLRAIASARGFPARTFHANLDFAAGLGTDLYRFLADRCPRQLGDWLFSVEAFGPAAPDPEARFLDEYVDDIAKAWNGEPEQLRDQLLRVRRDHIPAYLDALVDGYPWGDFRVVGFTSTFQQNTASVALARRLKERHPDLFVLFGGANLDGTMGTELLRAADCVDAAVIGEADESFPLLLDTLAEGGDLSRVPGLARRTADGVVTGPAARPVERLDDLPVPDYDEYFRHAEELGLLRRTARRTVYLPLETARGCWWGMKHHCTFCGLNGENMRFRAKSADRVLVEFAQLARRYRSFRFEAVDNILDTRYLRTLLPALVESDTRYDIFYEIKSNVSRAQIKLLTEAGVTQIQPGLESLSSSVLRLMRKGVTAAQNVNLLRWALHYGLEVSWNILWGFPGETPQDSADQAALLPYLWHLQPPASADRITLERFSPLHTGRAEFLNDLRPEPSYAYVYPADVDLDRIAYFFEGEVKGALPDTDHVPLRRAVAGWREAWRDGTAPPVLHYWQAPHYVQIYDGRRKGSEGTYLLEGLAADIHIACCERPVTVAGVRERLDAPVPVAEVERVLSEFADAGIVFRDGPLNVALAVPAKRP
ncbi:RiPP maturation radical SAM C-methyltransferase [Streptomyces geranii]|uniref:RiPP maturation radical SAM C-methyltransferase n=1 Tax=Streptomyces geranii TaxID=2058923 RepID=UPI000D03DD5F|nr:RiPP maturation radical SAM C-methyltransferase [Streptomyces geranii]